jgi:inosine-uridine nucleoside N-ribohydrolase
LDKIKVILDVDPGHDDMVAILLAAKHPRLDLRGITVVAGNQTLDKTVQNALRICTHAGIDVPVYAGMSRPLLRDQVVSTVHGESGLDGVELGPPARQVEEQHAVDFIIEEAGKCHKELVLIPVGPLTNIAMALLKEPRIVEGIKEIVLMGGACGQGNITPSAEFNIFVDPEAAQIVFTSGLPVTMVGLDATNQAVVYPPVLERIRGIGSRVSKMVVDSMLAYGAAYKALGDWEGPVLHDPCAVAYVIDPSVLKVKKAWVDVETARGLTYGRTVCDYSETAGKPANAQVAVGIDHKKLWDLLIYALEQY